MTNYSMENIDISLQPKRKKITGLIIRYPLLPTLVFFILMCVVFVFLSPANRAGENIFLSSSNLANIFEATAGFSIGAFAMALVLLVGCIDLSTEAIIALCAVVLGVCITVLGLDFFISLMITLGVGALCGLLNALICIKFKVASFLSTISVAFVLTGLAYTLSQSKSMSISNPILTSFFGPAGSGGSLLGIPVLLLWTLLLMILFYLLISHSKFGRWAQATGGNDQASYSSGVNINMVRTVAFILMGVVSAFIAVIFCARLGSSSPSFGVGYGLKFIIAAVLGGSGFNGEGGNVFGVLLGSLVIGVLTNGLGIIGVNFYTQQVITGIVILFAVIASIYLSNEKKTG